MKDSVHCVKNKILYVDIASFVKNVLKIDIFSNLINLFTLLFLIFLLILVTFYG